MDESLTVFYNPIFSLEISESSNNSAVYLKIAKQILKADELCVSNRKYLYIKIS